LYKDLDSFGCANGWNDYLPSNATVRLSSSSLSKRESEQDFAKHQARHDTIHGPSPRRVGFLMRELSLNEVAADESAGFSSGRVLPLLLVMFVGSGCAALIYEVVWFQLLELVIGSSTVSLGILLGTFMGGKAELLRAAELFFRGEVRPIVDRTFPLSDAAHAQRHLEAGEQFGKVVLTL